MAFFRIILLDSRHLERPYDEKIIISKVFSSFYGCSLIHFKLSNASGAAKSNDSVKNFESLVRKNSLGIVKNVLQNCKSIF